MSNILLDNILYRAFQLGDETETDTVPPFSGTPTETIELAAIKFRAYQRPSATIQIVFEDGYGYAPGSGDGSSGGPGDGTIISTNATVTTSLTGTNNDLTFTAVYTGQQGNNITITYIVAGINTPLSVVVSGTNIVVYVATDGSGNPISTAAEIAAAIAANPAASALISVSNAPGNDGTGIVTAMPTTSLGGGMGVVQPINNGGPSTFNPFMANGTAYIISAIPVIGMPVIPANATASVIAPVLFVNGSQVVAILSSVARATAYGLTPIKSKDPRISPISNATASITTPVLRVRPISDAAQATTAILAPVPGIKIISPIAASIANSSLHHFDQLHTAAAEALALVVSPIIIQGSFISGTAANSTASVSDPLIQIKVINTVATGTALTVWEDKVVISVLPGAASGTASVVITGIPKIIPSVSAIATASIVAPRRDPIHPPIAIATASAIAPQKDPRDVVIAVATASVTTPNIYRQGFINVLPVIATASVVEPSILERVISPVATSNASVATPIVKIQIDSTVAITTASVVNPQLINLKLITSPVAIANGNAFTLNASVTIGIREGVNATASVVAPNVISGVPPVVIYATPAISTANFTTPIPEIMPNGVAANATASITDPTLPLLAVVIAPAALATASTITFTTSTIIIVPRTVEATAQISSPALNSPIIVSVAAEATAQISSPVLNPPDEAGEGIFGVDYFGET